MTCLTVMAGNTVENVERPIALLDSGVGGLTVASEVIRQLPAENIIYYGDTLHLPYGPRLLDQVRKFVINITDFLYYEKEAKALVIACNTATSAALELVRERYPISVFGTINSATNRAYQLSDNGRIGIIGTEGTVNSQVYQKALWQIDQELEVFGVACPEFVNLVEAGRFDDPGVVEIAHKYLDGLKEAGTDVLILGCTHFPYLRPVIQRVIGEDVELVSSNVEMAREVKETLRKKSLLNPREQQQPLNEQELYVSDKSRVSRRFLEKGRKFLGLPDLKFEEKNLF